MPSRAVRASRQPEIVTNKKGLVLQRSKASFVPASKKSRVQGRLAPGGV